MESKRSGRRRFLETSGAALAGLAAGAVRPVGAQTEIHAPNPQTAAELLAYGQRSQFVKSVRMSKQGRPSPDKFGLVFHVVQPIQDQLGIVTPSSLHYVGTHRGSWVPEINPNDHRLMIHGLVEKPLTFTMDELKRLPFVARFHFVECLGNIHSPNAKTVQESHGMVSQAEWTGVPLSLLLKECGVQSSAKWVVSEGGEEVKGASCFTIGKAMDDVLVVYGQNGEALRPHQGFPLRLIVPGYEGIYQTKFLRRLKVVDKYYLTYNDYGHIRNDPKAVTLTHHIGPKSVITYPSGDQKLPGPGFYSMRGFAWSGNGAIRKVEVSTDAGKTWREAQIRSAAHPMAMTMFGYDWKWDGKEAVIMSRCTDEVGEVQPTRGELAKHFKKEAGDRLPPTLIGTDNTVMPWIVAADGSVKNGLSLNL